MEDIINSFYAGNAKKLRNMVDKILFKLKFVDVDNEDFYSLANEIFVDVLKRYDGKQDFNGFLYSCLTNKFKTEMTRRNRQKRQADKMSLSWEEKVGNNEETLTIGDIVADDKTIERISNKMKTLELEKFIWKEDKEFVNGLNGLIEAKLYDSTLTTESIANALNMSTRSLYRRLKDLGLPFPKEYLRERRMEKAVVLLQTTDKSIQEIIYECGFNNRAHFYKEFGKRYQVTPKEYRNINKKMDTSLN